MPEIARPSPLQNRAAPDGSLHAVTGRGSMMGNRGGRLHGTDARLGPARWRSRAWICCLTAFRDRHREVMGTGYTEIFFLDEATALAAGHRPCFECRRADARAFAAAWAAGQGLDRPPRAPEMDHALHASRLGRLETSTVPRMPPGAMFRQADRFWLWTGEMARSWSYYGYGPEVHVLAATPVVVLTPPNTRAALAAGYRAGLHPSAEIRA